MLEIINCFYEDIFELYKKIVSVSSESYDKCGIDTVCEIIAEFAEKNGFDVKTEINEKAGNELVLTYNSSNEGPLCVFLAHMDTVHKKGSFEEMFAEKGGKVYGPGVLDCKGGIAVALLTAMTLKKYGYTCPMRIVLVCDEEISMVLSEEKGIDFIKNNVRDAAYVFTCESGTKDKIVVGRKGAARYKITLQGKAAHAGSDYDKGVSAINAACKKIIQLESLSDISGITYNCGLISGGKAPNIVPDLCEFTVDVRYRSIAEMEESEKNLYRIVKSDSPSGIKEQIEVISKRIPMEATDKNMELFDRVKEISHALGYESFSPCIPGGASDAAFPASMGIPTLCGMGMTGKSQHTTYEEADISSLRERAHILAEAVISLYRKSL